VWQIDALSGAQHAAIPKDRMDSSLTFDPTGEMLVATYEAGYFQTWNLRLLRAQLAQMNLDWTDAGEVKSTKHL